MGKTENCFEHVGIDCALPSRIAQAHRHQSIDCAEALIESIFVSFLATSCDQDVGSFL